MGWELFIGIGFGLSLIILLVLLWLNEEIDPETSIFLLAILPCFWPLVIFYCIIIILSPHYDI